MDGLISNILFWPLTHEPTSAGRPENTDNQVCSDTGCRLEDLPKVLVNKYG